MLGSQLSGSLRFNYLKAKASELLCLMEYQYQRLNQKNTGHAVQLSDGIKVALHKVHSNIRKSPGSDLSIDALAREVGIKPNKLIASFKLLYGETLHQYVIQCRMERARQLLEDSDLSVQEISRLSGYSDQSGFNRAFRKIYGTTPLKIRH